MTLVINKPKTGKSYCILTLSRKSNKINEISCNLVSMCHKKVELFFSKMAGSIFVTEIDMGKQGSDLFLKLMPPFLDEITIS